MISTILQHATDELADLLPRVRQLAPGLQKLGNAMLRCWKSGKKVLIAGNGGSAADAMHFAEELIVRYARNRKALAAIPLCDPTVLTCAANDFGYETVFSRQVEALGNRGDILIVLTTSGNSPSITRALAAAAKRGLKTAAFLGKDGGQCRGQADFELLVPCSSTARIQEAHQLLFHVLCEWVDTRVPAR